MESAGPQPEFDSHSNSDFDETMPDSALTNSKKEIDLNIEDVDDLDKAIMDKMNEHPDYEVLNIIEPIHGLEVRIAVIKRPNNTILILREDQWDHPIE